MADAGWNFADQLLRHGPATPPWSGSFRSAKDYCAWVTRTHYENFSVASVLLPRRLVPHFQAVYSYCRWADDLADETGGRENALSLLDWWREELRACYAGNIRHPVFAALKPTIDRFRIPPEPFLDLLSAFEQDQFVSRYETYDQLLDYCRRSANPVGRLVLYLSESFTPENAILSDHVCTGLQLANFWQDIRCDLENLGRVYIPEEDRRRFGYPDADLEGKCPTPAFRELMRFEVARTREMFNTGEPLLGRLPRDVRSDIDLFLRGGRAILDRIENLNYDVWTTRPKLTKGGKAKLILGAMLGRFAGWFR
ncbi:squalene synthase HpnC [Zavarzinella formosa]|uniref:squalene synthase HpnC n=1 Tax=Zavarzinella formosa TaxID=360055 RepID=UPI000594DF4E|nr:squalene synthase HpnC [Zavarzinella formosa]